MTETPRYTITVREMGDGTGEVVHADDPGEVLAAFGGLITEHRHGIVLVHSHESDTSIAQYYGKRYHVAAWRDGEPEDEVLVETRDEADEIFLRFRAFYAGAVITIYDSLEFEYIARYVTEPAPEMALLG